MFVVKENYRRCGIGTKIWSLAINHLGEFRNKGLSAIPKMFSIYRDKAGFKCIAEWNMVLFKLDGKKLLANLADFLKTAQQKLILLDASSTNFVHSSNDFSNSSIRSNSDEDLNCDDFDENESPNPFDEDDAYQTYKNYQNHQKNIHNSFSSPVSCNFRQLNCLKEITNEVDNLKDWNQRNKHLNDAKIQKLNQLINYSTLKPHHLSINYSTKVFQINNKSSPSISLPSLLQNDTFNLVDNNFFQQNSSPQINLNSSNQIGSSNINIIKIVPYQACWLKKLIDYDRFVSGYNRNKIVKLSVKETNCKTKLAIFNNQVVGYCSIKMGLQNVYLVAPLYANSSEIANKLLVEFVRSMSIEQLVKGLILKLPGKFNFSKILS